jgi:hypothetical protein
LLQLRGWNLIVVELSESMSVRGLALRERTRKPPVAQCPSAIALSLRLRLKVAGLLVLKQVLDRQPANGKVLGMEAAGLSVVLR